MYDYTNEANYEYNPQDAFQPVPNVMMDDGQLQPQQQQQQQPQPHLQHTVQQGILQIQQSTFVNSNEGIPSVDVAQNVPVPITIYAVDGGVTQFEIADLNQRRAFVQRVFGVLLLQNIIVLPLIEIFLLCVEKPISIEIYFCIWLLSLCIFTAMYSFSEARRYSPMNVIGLLVVTLFWVIQESAYAMRIGTQAALLSQLIIITQIFAIILYSKQTRFQFTNINAILLVLLIFIAAIGVVSLASPSSLQHITHGTVFHVIYFVYDTHLMLTGHHGYNLQADEHIFAATNIYVDLSNLLWRILKYLFITPIVKIYQFFSECCGAEVC